MLLPRYVFRIHTGLILREGLSHEQSLGFCRSRRASASGVAAVILAIMFVATAASGAIIYYSRGGASPAVGINSPSGNGLSGALSNPELTNLTSALGGLSNPAPTNLTSSLGGLSGSVSNSTLANVTASLGGNVAVEASSLPAADFTAAGTTSTFTCAASPSGAYLAITNNGTEGASVTSLSIASTGGVTTFTPVGACNVGAAGSGAAATYIILPTTSQISPSPAPGSYYSGVVSLSDGSQIPFGGTWL